MADITGWSEADLRRFIANVIRVQPAGLPRSLRLEELGVANLLDITDRVKASPQALEYLRGGRRLLAVWQEMLPLSVDNAVTWIVPRVDGKVLAFGLDRAFFRFETAEVADVTVRIERSPSGSAFDPTTVVDLTVAAGDYETSVTSGLGQISSGDLLRIVWIVPGAVTDNPYIVQLEGVQQ